MPLKKLAFKAGVNRENTRYTNENGWYESDKVRFRQGTPEKIGGWQRISANTFLGVCRSLWPWSTFGGATLTGVGTNLKFYVEQGSAYYDVTPIRSTVALGTDPFTGDGTTTVVVTSVAHGCVTGDFVTFTGATGAYDTIFNAEFQVTVLTPDTYTITTSEAILAGSYGGAAVTAAYQINIGAAYAIPVTGWGSGGWGEGPWGIGEVSATPIRLWQQANFGEDLVIGYRDGPMYLWNTTNGTSTRAVPVSSLPGASDVPLMQSYLTVSDISRFVFAFGTNDYGSAAQNPMLLRWSNQEDLANWTPSATSQAGSLLLSHGSKIVSALQSRQEILVFTDSSLYSLQYIGAPAFWGSQLLGDNISVASPNAVTIASGVTYWMGVDKFYKYDGRVQTLRCDLRQFIYNNINLDQADQFFASTNEGFNEVWFFYCTAGSTTIDRYVVYNYAENNGEGVWYYGSLARTAWVDAGTRDYPLAATYLNNLVDHEFGVDDNSTEATLPIAASIGSSEFDIEDGDRFGFIWRVLPDVTFRGSQTNNPQVTLTLIPMQNSGSGFNDPQSVGGTNSATVTRTATVPIEQFTGQVYVRVRGRQLILKMQSDQIGCAWQMGSPRVDIRQDGRRGNT